jgi:hypothetical protein
MSSHAKPDFLIIGAQKAGTTSLYEYMVKHPAIEPASKKEIHYFDKNFYKGRWWYRSHFPKKSRMPDKITGEASPSYLFYPGTARRIQKVLPGARLLVLLRNPVDRAISSYFHQQQKGVEKLSLEDALDMEEKRLARYGRRLGYGWFSAGSSKNFRRFAYLTRGLYARQLREYFRYFPRKQLWVEQSELFFLQPARVLKEAFGFLEIDGSFVPADLTPRNVHHYEQVPRATRKELEAFYRPHNEELFELLGHRFNWDSTDH